MLILNMLDFVIEFKTLRIQGIPFKHNIECCAKKNGTSCITKNNVRK